MSANVYHLADTRAHTYPGKVTYHHSARQPGTRAYMYVIAQETIMINTAPGVKDSAGTNSCPCIHHDAWHHYASRTQCAMAADNRMGVHQSDYQCTCVAQLLKLCMAHDIASYRNDNAVYCRKLRHKRSSIPDYRPVAVMLATRPSIVKEYDFSPTIKLSDIGHHLAVPARAQYSQTAH